MREYFEMLKAKAIFFSGIDGSGKSTHARILINELQSHNKSVKYVWMRGYGKVLFSLPLLVLCKIVKITRVKKLDNNTVVSLYPFYRYRPLRLVWPWLQLIDSAIYNIVLVKIPLFIFKQTLLIDRSAIDTFVDVMADTNTAFTTRFQNLFLALLPKESFVIIFDVEDTIALARKNDVFDLSYLRERRRMYKLLCKKYGWPLLSTREEFSEVHELVKMRLLQLIVSKQHNQAFYNETHNER